MSQPLTEEELKDFDTWIEGGLDAHFTEKGDWVEIAHEASRLLEAEEYSPESELLHSAISASWHCAIDRVASYLGVRADALSSAVAPDLNGGDGANKEGGAPALLKFIADFEKEFPE